MLREGDTPTLRLEQDGSGGFAPETWSISANETQFSLRVASTFSRPVSVAASAPDASLVVTGDGKLLNRGRLVASSTGAVLLPAAAFHVAGGYQSGSSPVFSTGVFKGTWTASGSFVIGTGALNASFELPGGATMTDVTCWMHDYDPDVSGTLYTSVGRYDVFEDEYSTQVTPIVAIFSVSSAGAQTSLVSGSAPAILEPVVPEGRYVYYLQTQLYIPEQILANPYDYVGFAGCRVLYDQP